MYIPSFISRLSPVGLVCLGLVIGIATAHAGHDPTALRNVRLNISDFDQIEDYIRDGVGTPEDNIPANLNAAQCGGWDFELTVEESIGDPGKVAKVQGVPGREAVGENPLTQVHFGMAARDEAFVYPNGGDTCGFNTACRPPGFNTDDPRRIVPFLDRHPCQRPLDGYRGDDFYDNDPLGDPNSDSMPRAGVTWSCGGGRMRNAEGDYCAEHNSAGLSGGLCQALNEYIYPLFEKPITNSLGVTIGYNRLKGNCYKAGQDEEPEPPEGYTKHSDRYCCTDAEVGSADMNCILCSGASCRNGPTFRGIRDIQWDYCFDDPPSCPTRPFDGRPTRTYRSYFRHYKAEYERGTITSRVPDDDAERDYVPTACYGIYREFDPKLRDVTRRDHNCVIGAGYEESSGYGDIHYNDMGDTQTGKGEYGQNSGFPDRDSNAEIRDEYDVEEDLWHAEFGRSFSLLNGVYLEEELDGNLSFALLAPDVGEQEANVQMTEDRPLSAGAIMRAFDDTVADINQKRTAVNWWQEQQTEAHKLFSPPVIRMLLPPAWALGLDPERPLLIPAKIPDLNKNPLVDPIEIQLQVTDDTLGEVAQFLESALIVRTQEERVPLVVPAGTGLEWLGIKEKWCYFLERKAFEANPNNPPTVNCDNINALASAAGVTDVVAMTDFMNKVDIYQRRIEEVRKLRAELTTYMAEYLQMHNEVNQVIGEWAIETLQQFVALQSQRQQRLALQADWERVFRRYVRFHDRTNMPWCKNDRYTTPVYSFLDNWLSTPQAGDGPDLAGLLLPRLSIPQFPDVVLDFTHLRTATGAISMPVLDPIRVRMNLREFNNPSLTDIPELPDLPPIPYDSLAIQAEVLANIPSVLTGSITIDDGAGGEIEVPDVPPSVSDLVPPVALDTGTIQSRIQEIEEIIRIMNNIYGRFWESIKVDPGDLEDGTEEDCLEPRQGLCVHVEMDLKERFTRIAARPGVQLLEDFTSIGEFMDPTRDGYDFCPTTDWVCQLLNPEITQPRFGWDINLQGGGRELIDEYRTKMFFTTLLREDAFDDTEDNRFPYIVSTSRILPSFDIPEEIVLLTQDITPLEEISELIVPIPFFPFDLSCDENDRDSNIAELDLTGFPIPEEGETLTSTSSVTVAGIPLAPDVVHTYYRPVGEGIVIFTIQIPFFGLEESFTLPDTIANPPIIKFVFRCFQPF